MMKNLFRVFVSAIVLLFAPDQALAAKASDTMTTPNKPMLVEPVSVQKLPTTKVVKPIAGIKQTQPAVNLPPAAKVEAIKKPVNPNTRPATMTIPTNIQKLPDNQTIGNVNVIRDASQVRDLGAAKDAAEAARNIPGMVERSNDINPDLGLGRDKGPVISSLPGHDGGVDFSDPTGRLPVMPGNQGSKRGGSPLTPSMNPADWMSGASSKPSGGHVIRLAPTRFDNRDGSVRFSWTEDESNGGSRVTRTDYADGEWMEVIRFTDETSALRTGMHTRGGFVVTAIFYDSDGNETSNNTLETSPPTINETQDPDSADNDGKWARWGAQFSGQRPDLSLKNPNQVNPGPGGAVPDLKAPRLALPEDQLVINPDPNTVGGAGRTPDQRTAELMRQQVQAGAGPGVRPPSPSNSDALNNASPQGQ